MRKLPRPSPALLAFAPTLLGIALDFALRGRSLLALSTRGKIGYFASSFVGVGFWFVVVYALAQLAKRKNRGGFFAVLAFVVFPFAVFGYGVQAYYVTVFDTYISRDTLRLGIAFNGTVIGWLRAWGVKLVPAIILSLVFTAALGWAVRRFAEPIARTRFWVPLATFAVSFFLFFRDVLVSTEWLQSPDAALQNAFVGLVHDSIFPKAKRGLTYRHAVSVPPIAPLARRPNVLLIITESVRADMSCSEKTDACASRYLDGPAGDRVGLTRMTAQSSGTITSCMTLWTGLGPDADIHVTHTTPFLWEVAKSVGYRTAYVASQDLRAFGLGPYLANAGIDLQITGEDFGDVQEIHIGCPDERAAQRMLEYVRGDTSPWFAVLHFSNTHYPFRVDPELQPFAPHDDSPFTASIDAVKNHIKNSLLLQERTLSEMLRGLRALPAFEDTVVLFVSDHGDQLREHGALFHLNSLFDEEVRVPAWMLAGARALSVEQRAAFATHHDRRVFHEDVNATILDLLGALEARVSFPNGARLQGASLLRPPPPAPPVVSMSTTSGVWFDDGPVFGVMSGEWKVTGKEAGAWGCYDVASDPAEKKRLEAPACPAPLVAEARRRFPNVP